jgi:hypothetical protein
MAIVRLERLGKFKKFNNLFGFESATAHKSFHNAHQFCWL